MAGRTASGRTSAESARSGRITDVPGIAVGCWTDPAGKTGCTVVLCLAGAVVAADVRGAAPGTRETDLAHPGMLVERAHAVLLAGGSAYGLAAADGVMRWLEARGVGFAVGGGVVPIVPAAVVYDLGVREGGARPDGAAGYQACETAGDEVPEGNAGAGAGCTVGKLLGIDWAMRGGQGTAAVKVAGPYIVGALVVVNAAGDVLEPGTAEVLAGTRLAEGGFAGPGAWLDPPGGPEAVRREAGAPPALNTTIGVVATDVPLTKEQAQRVAWMAQDGLARAIQPAHTPFDGDTLFVLSTAPSAGTPSTGGPVSPRMVAATGAAAAEVVARSIVRAVRAATSLPGLPVARDLHRSGGAHG